MARLREFEIGEALDGVMDVFWRQGYEGASMQDIEAATGLNKQSLYRIFPDKRAMYLAALERYEAKRRAKSAPPPCSPLIWACEF
jgi:AcrR family transcriptional regulator